MLKCFLSPGDIVMLTAAVRDLHKRYPNRFITEVRTSSPELWENNPYLTPLSEADSKVEVISCAYPLIDRCNEAPYHCVHGFIHFLNDRLGLRIEPTAFKGDIHLSGQEKLWYSQVHELTGLDTPFWIIAAGGKYDVTIKWWQTERFQAVVDHFRGKIQFVQVGEFGHHHPRLDGAIDLRGQTSLREMVRLVYHAQGVLCPVTALMHLAAAVEVRGGCPANRPCVVVAGGREPAHWEAYPDHQFIHTTGALRCCSNGGCWKDRVVRLGDGDERDKPEHLCVDVAGPLPRCMDLITAEEVIRRIKLYFDGGALQYLAPAQSRAAKRGVTATAKNAYDDQPLTLQSARAACARFIGMIPEYPRTFRGRGVVICGGGTRYFTCAWVCVNMLRRLGCSLPIQLWHRGPAEIDQSMKALVAPLGVECVDACEVAQRHPARRLGGWELKPYAILHCPFKEVLLLDADNVPVRDPEFLFETPQFRRTGAIFWPDYGRKEKANPVWHSCGVPRPEGPEFESGQIVLDKERCWPALRLCLWFNEQSDFYYRYLHGDKETFHLAFRKLNKEFSFVPTPIHSLLATMCQHDFQGRRLFQHRNLDKWNLFARNRFIEDFWFETECRADVLRLQALWDGGTSRFRRRKENASKRRHTLRQEKLPTIEAWMITCAEREQVRTRTLGRLRTTDWGDQPVHVQLDREAFAEPEKRQAHTALLALKGFLKGRSDFLLFLEDDLAFNRHIRHNLLGWRPLREREITLASLYNPYLGELAVDVSSSAVVIGANTVFGSQAFVVSRAAAGYIVDHWAEVEGMQDIKMSRLAGRLNQPILYHAPSLVQHVGKKSLWGGHFHRSFDFDPAWKA
ncbi:MAG: glycosyltransferase family 9 protein [Limisphaerales bacterium]